MLRLSHHARRMQWVLYLTLITILAVGDAKPAIGQTGVINPLNYVGGNLCAKIQTAISANAAANPQGLVIDARSASGSVEGTGQVLSVSEISQPRRWCLRSPRTWGPGIPQRQQPAK